VPAKEPSLRLRPQHFFRSASQPTCTASAHDCIKSPYSLHQKHACIRHVWCMKHIVKNLQTVFLNQLTFSISQRDQLRTLRCYALLVSLGTLFAWLPLSAHWHGFGLGLIVPGGSYLMYLAGDNYQIFTNISFFQPHCACLEQPYFAALSTACL